MSNDALLKAAQLMLDWADSCYYQTDTTAELISAKEKLREALAASKLEPKAQAEEPEDADFAYWYWRACETSRPRDWMHAALHAQRILKTKQPDATISQAQESLQ